VRKWIKYAIGIVFLLCFLGNIVSAQEISLYNQYRLNEFLINPAVAGYDGYTTINITAREQWIGLDNSPRTNTISIQSRLLKSGIQARTKAFRRGRGVLRSRRSGNVAIGGFGFNDTNGLIRRTGFQSSYAYHLRIKNQQLSFGLSAFIYQFHIDVSQVKFKEQTDSEMVLLAERENQYIPDVGVGVAYLSNTFMVGVSATHLVAAKYKLNDATRTSYDDRQYYGIAKYKFMLDGQWAVEPVLFLKANERMQLQADISATMLFGKDYWFGMGYRYQNSMLVLMGLRYDRMYFGYSFDYMFSELTSTSLGAHEFSVSIKLGNNARRFRWLERY